MIAKRNAGLTGIALGLCAPLLLCSVDVAHAQSASESTSTEHAANGVPIDRIIAAVAKKTGKKFVLDPRVRGDIVIIGQEPANVSYNDLLSVLALYGYVAVATGDYVTILPDANARQGRSPILSGKESYPDAEVVSVVITPKNVPAAQLVPILRPLIPQYGHLAAVPCVNKLLLVDRFANVKRLQAIIEALDVGEPYKPEKCEDSYKSSSK